MQNGGKSFDFLTKVIIIGDAGVGKTCLLLRFCENSFLTSHLPTIGLDFKLKTIRIDDKRVKIQIWDTAGQERFKTITQTYFRSSHGVILNYAVNDRESFINIESWIEQVKLYGGDNISMVLVGNKTDLPGRCVDYEEGARFARKYNIPFFETSTKEGENIQSVFETILRDIITKMVQTKKDGLEKAKSKRPDIPLKPSSINEQNCCF